MTIKLIKRSNEQAEMDNAINELCKRVQLRWKKESFGEAKSVLFDRIEQRWDE